MTRANFYIVTRAGKFKFQANSSAYPSEMMAPVLIFAASTASNNPGAINGFYQEPDSNAIATLIETCGLTFGYVGNFSYHYEIDFIKQTVTVWGETSRWVNAPLDWVEKGWNCYKGSGNKGYGYTTWVKGKKIYSKAFKNLINDANILSEAESI